MSTPQRYAWALCTTLTLALVAGCSGDSDGSGESTEKGSPKPTRTAPVQDDPKLGQRVKEALGTDELEDTGTLVESGLERVSDGVHTRPKLSPGRSYQVAVACAGKGKISLSIRAEKHTRETVDCDGVPVTQRTVGSRSNLEIDTSGLPGVRGMVGWRVSKVAK
ncbi:DUF3558 domain-containing protein [Streptomyces alboflavus]|uniref:hypothetical protein n=1 Tax=Streptomyces alboflavus TaxID=67267 RepID=UPI00367FBDE0